MRLGIKKWSMIGGMIITVASVLGYLGHKEFADKEKNESAHAAVQKDMAVISTKMDNLDKKVDQGFRDSGRMQREILRKLK